MPVLEAMTLDAASDLNVNTTGPVVDVLHRKVHLNLLGTLLGDEVLADPQVGDGVRIHLGPTPPDLERVALGAARLLNPLWNLRQRGALP